MKNDLVNTFPDEQVEAMVAMVFRDQLSDQAIADHFKMSKPTFYKIKRTQCFQKALKLYGEVAVRLASAKIQAHSERAVKVLVDVMSEGSDANRLRAATELLRLAGLNERLPEFTLHVRAVDHRALVLQHLANLTQTNGK